MTMAKVGRSIHSRWSCKARVYHINSNKYDSDNDYAINTSVLDQKAAGTCDATHLLADRLCVMLLCVCYVC